MPHLPTKKGSLQLKYQVINATYNFNFCIIFLFEYN